MREHCAREARDCPLPRRRRQTQSRPRGSRLGRELEHELQRDPCRTGGTAAQTDFCFPHSLPLKLDTVKLGLEVSVCVPENVTQRDLGDVPLQDFHLCTDENPSVHLTNSISDVLQHQLLKASARQEKTTIRPSVSHISFKWAVCL